MTIEAITSDTKLPRGRRALEVLATEQLAELRAIRATTTEQAARASGRLINNTVVVATAIFPTTTDGSTPSIMFDHRVAIGAVKITNLSAANRVTFAPSQPTAYAPGAGVGIGLVLPNSRDTISCDTHVFTLYGTAGDTVTVQAYARGVTPTS